MYKAIIPVGGYKIGEEVPTDRAEFWNKVYAVPHAVKVSEEVKESEPEKKEKSAPEDKYEEDDLFFKELTKIKGIGAKTAKDIVVWGNKEKLIEIIKLKKDLPFRDDVDLKLRRKYG